MVIPSKGETPVFTVTQQRKADAYYIDDIEHCCSAEHPQQLFFPAARIGKNKCDPETGNSITQAAIYQLYAAATNQA